MATEHLGICHAYDVLLKAKNMKPKTLFLVCLIVFLLTSFLVSTSFFVASVHANPDTLTLRPNANGTCSQFVEVPNSGFIWGDQFESDSFSLWTGTTGTAPSIVTLPVHHGSYAMSANLASYSLAHEDITAKTHVYYRFYFRATALPASGKYVIILYLEPASGYRARLRYENSGGTYRWGLLIDSDPSYTYFNEQISINTWYCLEVEYDSDTGVHNLYRNGVNIIQITRATSTNSVTRTFLGADGTWDATGYFDCVGISTSYIGTENRSNLVNDSSDNTALQVTANTTQKETENLADTAQTGTINSVTAYMRAQGTAVTNQAVIVWRTHSTDYESPSINMTTSFADYSNATTTNPNTGVAWTWDEVNALEVGARASTLPSGTIQFSEFYITVTYTSDATPPTYSSISTNTTLANNPCSFNCLVSDDTNVSSYIFSTNNTGTWTNDTGTTFVNFFNTTAAWANVTKTLNDTVGNVVSYVWYANDTSNNWSSSDQHDLTLTAPYRPSLQMTPDNVTCRIYLETFSIQINVTNANDAQAFNFTIYYDPQVLNCSSVSWGELGTGTMTETDTTNGILEGNVAGSPLNGNHWLLNITFQADKAIIWKNPADKLEGKIWFHQAQLNFTDNSTLQYIEGGINQIDVNQAAYTFLPIQGDVNNDGTVNVLDIRIIAFYYGKTLADPEWPAASKYDLNNDNTIDILDLRVVTANFGFTYP